MDYISNTPREKEKMLDVIGAQEINELFAAIPEKVRLKRELNIDGSLSELELKRQARKLTDRNNSLNNMTSFLGAGAYDHYVPSIIDHLISRSEYYTAYTPYQAELSQGTLQAIYEFQSMICELTGMGVANASLLDGGSAVGEAVLMAQRITRKNRIIFSRAIHPAYREVARTYGSFQGLEFVEAELRGGTTDLDQFENLLDDQTAAVVIQYPNFYGSLEQMERIQSLLEEQKKILMIVIANPMTLGLLTPPSEWGADIVIGEGQVLGNQLNYGGPYLGYMATRDDRGFIRQMPGRIAGATTDADGNRGYVLTLQTREQHIRREKATSNICSNEALNALIATIYMSAMGKEGLKEVAEHSLQKAHYLADKIDQISGYQVVNKENFFHEFWVKTPVEPGKLIDELREKGIIPGLDLSRFDEEEGLLICTTEKRTREEMDNLVSALEVVSNG